MKFWIMGLAAAVAFPVPAAAEVVATSDAGFFIRHSAEVTATPEDAWKELVNPAGWWNKAHTWSGDAANLYIDGQATGCFCEKLPAPKDAPAGRRPGSVEHMRIVHVDPGKVLRMTGALGPLQSEALTGTLTITLRPANGRTRIRWEYVVGGYMRYKTAEIAPAVDKMLGEQLGNLVAKLGPVAPPAGDGKPAAIEMPASETDPRPAEDKPATSGAAPKASDPKFLDGLSDQPKEDGAEKTEAPASPRAASRRRPAVKDGDDYVEPTR